jgi:uncharacterized protein YjeT (DUF2065 family)
MVHLPQGIAGWTVFCTGILIALYRIHGIDAPRAWIELIERQFTHSRAVRFAGALLAIVSAGIGYLAIAPQGAMLWLFIVSLTMLELTGLCLALAPNHAHHLVFATAEEEDTWLRVASVVIVLFGLGLALAPWML